MLATPIIYRTSLAMPGCKATPERVDLLKMLESRYEVETVVRGYHVYMGIWDAAIGETLECVQELTRYLQWAGPFIITNTN